MIATSGDTGVRRRGIERYPAFADPPLIDGIVNLNHLDWLSVEVLLAGEPALLTHIYCEAPEYGWFDAAGEGIVALDDVARAALVYLDFWVTTGQPRALARARAALNFVLYMRAERGTFYNFVFDYSGELNRTGITSVDSLDWWTCRAFWALARGYAIFQALDPAFAARLQDAYLATERLLAERIGEVGRFTSKHGFAAPAWLPSDSAALAALAALGLAEFQEAAPNERTAQLLTALADGLAAYQLGGPGAFPWGLHPHTLKAPLPWHGWGTHEAQALARAGRVMARPDWVASARREVEGFFAWQLIGGHLHALNPLPLVQGQQAYGVNCLVQAALECYRATGDDHFARLAGLHASWFLGNNVAGRALYDPASGRGYDGIDRHGEINPHAGAESTIEALMALQAVAAVPEALRFLDYRAQAHRSWYALPLLAVEGESAAQDVEQVWRLSDDGTAVEWQFTVTEAADYLLYLGSRKQQEGRTSRCATVTLDERESWSFTPPTVVRQYPWLDLLTPVPVTLAAGRHRCRLTVAGVAEPADLAHLAGVLVQEVRATRRFVGPDGDTVALTLDMQTGALDWSW